MKHSGSFSHAANHVSHNPSSIKQNTVSTFQKKRESVLLSGKIATACLQLYACLQVYKIVLCFFLFLFICLFICLFIFYYSHCAHVFFFYIFSAYVKENHICCASRGAPPVNYEMS